MKQTAVEFYHKTILDILQQFLTDEITKTELIIKMHNAIYAAKAMEKEQIIDAANTLLYHSTGPGNTAAEQYYNETYGKE